MIPSTFLIFMGLFNFFSLKPCFLANSELITSPIVPLSNNTSTVIPSCVSTLSSPIFTITFLKSLPSALPTLLSVPFSFNVLAFIPVANILNLLQKSSQGTLDSPPLLNSPSVHDVSLFLLCTPASFPPLLCSSASYSGSVRPYTQILHRYSSFSPCLSPSHMNCVAPTLPSVVGALSPHSFSPLLLSEWALSLSTEVALSASSAILRVMALLISAPVVSEPFLPLLFVLSTFLSPFCSPSSFCLGQLLFHTTVLLSLVSVQSPSISS